MQIELFLDAASYGAQICLADLAAVHEEEDLISQLREEPKNVRSMLGVQPAEWRVHDYWSASPCVSIQGRDEREGDDLLLPRRSAGYDISS